jgi:outer membrane protein OmpA-like peptidoglycan-associated protein
MRLSILALLACLAAKPAAAQSPASEQPFRLFFDWGKPELTRDAQATLDEVVAAYHRLQPNRVEIAGHADRSGPDAVNVAASRRRAAAVKTYLAAHGVAAAAISVSAYGETRPIIVTEDGVREAQNRRVEISFN